MKKLLVIKFVVVAVLMAACSETASPEPTASPRPTLTPLPTKVLNPILRQATTIEDIAGTWGFCRSGDEWCFYYQYLQDGTYTGAATPSRERVENTPGVMGEFWFEGTKLHLKMTSAGSPRNAGCIGNIGIYETHLIENGDLRFVLVEDECGWRSKDLPRSDYSPVELTE